MIGIRKEGYHYVDKLIIINRCNRRLPLWSSADAGTGPVSGRERQRNTAERDRAGVCSYIRHQAGGGAGEMVWGGRDTDSVYNRCTHGKGGEEGQIPCGTWRIGCG